MFHQDRGVRMCYYKKIRDELGTINYNPVTESIPNPKIDLVEMFQIEKRKKKKEKKKTQKRKKIRIEQDKKSKIDQILELASLPVEEDTEQERIDEEEKKEEKIEKEEIEKEEIEKEDIKIINLDPNNTDTEDTKDTEEKQDGGHINPFKKRIYVTNLTVDKDKEMFQM